MWGNPLAVFGLCVALQQVTVSRIEVTVSRLAVGGSAYSLIKELSWLRLVYQRQNDTADAGMGRIMPYARGYSAQFRHMGHAWA